MRSRNFALATVVMAVTLAGCQRQSDEKLVELAGRMFVFNYRVATANYMIVLKKVAPIPEGTFAVAEFQNPKGDDPLVLREKIYALSDRITLASPFVHCVRKDQPYAVSIRLVDSSDRTLQTIKTEVTSDVDQSVLPAKPLVLGPIYTKNPEVFRPDGTADFSPEVCPAT
ncbi:hypothetical protein [Rhizobium sp. BK251]|uniref:hypothetical protein n=1 Tax=Rhizobium sp. BK251 TaxID=2512125 RepID=UPI00105239FA|nr:hypothetical protein [Rhizobium sp. BK251]TCL70251.1 hypothetical protein EV286_107120 [Rhizobium sp. BK251]